MILLNHDIAHEFPEHLEKMHQLKASDPRFARLFADYDQDNHAITKVEQGTAAISEEALEVLKKRRLKLKDEIYEILKAS